METKQEFLDGLRRALVGKIRPQEVEEHIRYYDEYITAEMRRGRVEIEVMDSLGSPSWIAMSICDANKAGKEASDKKESSEYTGAQYETYEDAYGQTNTKVKTESSFVLRHPKLTIALIIVVILLILGIGIWLAVSLVSFFWPVIVTVVVAMLLVRLVAFIRQNW